MPIRMSDPCGVCRGPVYSWYWDFTEKYDPETDTTPEEDAVMCDVADSRGCFRMYHSGCFRDHVCPVHPKEPL